MAKDTAVLLEELKRCSDFNRFYNENSESFPKINLASYLQQLLEKYSLKKADVIRRSELNQIYAYQIFSGVRIPERKKLLSLAVGMGLSLSEIQNLMKVAGHAQLYAKDPDDCVVIYGIYKNYSVAQINYMLFDYGMETLG